MDYFKQILGFARPYTKYAILNILCNIFYALFSALSFIALIPMLDVLFNKEQKITQLPKYKGFTESLDYFKDYMAYQIELNASDDPSKALLIVISLIITLFFLKNIFNYLAM